MKKTMCACPGVLLAVLLSAMAVRAEKLETDYFALTLPADWELTKPMQFKYLEGGSLLVRHKREDLLVGVAILPFWCEGMENMREVYEREIRELGYTVERSIVSGNVLRVDIRGDDDFRGRYYGTVGERASSQVVIYGTASLEAGKALLRDNLKPFDSTLFPTSW